MMPKHVGLYDYSIRKITDILNDNFTLIFHVISVRYGTGKLPNSSCDKAEFDPDCVAGDIIRNSVTLIYC
jgi:hypothetical protein